MPDTSCPVSNTTIKLDEMINSGRLVNPKSRRIAEELLELINDVAWGRAGGDHVPAIESLTQELVKQGPVNPY